MANTVNCPEHPLEWYRERIAYLSEFMLPERERKLREVLSNRTRYMAVCMENAYYAQNASALIRHCDAFGIQDIHAVESTCNFRTDEGVAKGSGKWITIHRHSTTTDAVAALKSAGYRIIAATPHKGDTMPEDFDVAAGRFALVFGTELEGISPETDEAADGFIRIPMCGFVESLNVSASAAILIYILSSKLRDDNVNRGLGEEEKLPLLFEWMVRTVRAPEKLLARFESSR